MKIPKIVIPEIEIPDELIDKVVAEYVRINSVPANAWIPCSKELPEQYSVLCCDKYGEMMVAHPFEDEESNNGFSAESEECYMFECVAWMPLPEPYKGDNNED